MLFKPDPNPPTVQQIAKAFRLTGWLSFWTQAVLTVVSTIILLFAAASSGLRPANSAPSPGTGSGLLLTFCGLGALGFSIYWAFRYTRLGRRLSAKDSEARPKKADTIQAVRIGITLNLGGMLLTLLGLGATLGGLFVKAATQQGSVFNNDPSRLIQAVDILVVQSSINIMLGLFVGLVAGFFLLNRIIR
ncbi:MAG: DUF3611 family protein [Leptolyngbyaceae cyanobacterium bins.59]|nr:DUF3611 family protein [Leptolyngbyaceae cyanobacterium bins.59]